MNTNKKPLLIISTCAFGAAILLVGQTIETDAANQEADTFFNSFILDETEINESNDENIVVIENQEDPYSAPVHSAAAESQTYFSEDGRILTNPDATEIRSLTKEEEKTIYTKNPVQTDKMDDSAYFSKNKGQIDKKDSGNYFTQNKKLIDKPDSAEKFTQADPCLRDDGTIYTGPGTVHDPFVVGDPCLEFNPAIPDQATQFASDDTKFTSDDPCLDEFGNPISTVGLLEDDPCAPAYFTNPTDVAAVFATTEGITTTPPVATPPTTIPPTTFVPTPPITPPLPGPLPSSNYRMQGIG